MSRGDIRTFDGKRYRQIGWSRTRIEAEHHADEIAATTGRSMRVVMALASDNKTWGYDIFREIKSR